MERLSVTRAVRQFSDLMNRVFYQGSIVELERGNKVLSLLPRWCGCSPTMLRKPGRLWSCPLWIGMNCIDWPFFAMSRNRRHSREIFRLLQAAQERELVARKMEQKHTMYKIVEQITRCIDVQWR